MMWYFTLNNKVFVKELFLEKFHDFWGQSGSTSNPHEAVVKLLGLYMPLFA